MNDVNHATITALVVDDPKGRKAGETNAATIRVVIGRDKKVGDRWERGPGCFIDVDCFGRAADDVMERVRKGAKLFIDGRLELQTWEKDGQPRSKHAIVADRIEVLELPERQQRTSSDYASVNDRAPRGQPAADIPF